MYNVHVRKLLRTAFMIHSFSKKSHHAWCIPSPVTARQVNDFSVSYHPEKSKVDIWTFSYCQPTNTPASQNLKHAPFECLHVFNSGTRNIYHIKNVPVEFNM